MTKTKPYGMICPITRACDLLEPRWTIPILVALWGGYSKFNELRRTIGSISPALLSRRLKEMEQKGLVERIEDRATGSVDYIRTDLAIALEPALNALAQWAQQGLDAELALCTTATSNLMWRMRDFIIRDALPRRRIVMQFHFNEDIDYDTYWTLIQPEAPVEICSAIPGFDVDLYVETTTISLMSIIQGRSTIEREKDLGELFLSGDAMLTRTVDRWLKIGDYARFEGIRQLSADRSISCARQDHAGGMRRAC